MIAPLLADADKHLDLVKLYGILTSNELCALLKKEEIQDSMIASLTLSAQVSIQFIRENDPESMDLFFILSMLPGGVTPAELDLLWSKHNQLKTIKDAIDSMID